MERSHRVRLEKSIQIRLPMQIGPEVPPIPEEAREQLIALIAQLLLEACMEVEGQADEL